MLLNMQQILRPKTYSSIAFNASNWLTVPTGNGQHFYVDYPKQRDVRHNLPYVAG
jgi:hypothetical protein